MKRRIQLGRLFRIDFIQAFGHPASLAAIKELGYGRSIQLAARHPELAGCGFSQFEKIVGKRDCSFHKWSITQVIP